jgi:competence ComEA-like helix-hairpin-helix protein
MTREESRIVGFLALSIVLGSVALLTLRLGRRSPELLSAVEVDLSSGESVSPVDVNRATFDELVAVPGIGPVLAQRILDLRESEGEFETLQELIRVRGIGEKTLRKIEPFLWTTGGLDAEEDRGGSD